ncbi:tyrosine-type recombinase/integrase [Pseudomonas sp.]|uniref:tyrosine-type recombinase/integrase n=1 Tax=Pseudomonas sp. TaxID=306 RepID=UPI0027322CE4|nr:tyrosine-type recombinase/integrase [Pseudomonas sp.]MDP2745965.1 tyrosine-type recombinase/integrase [Pseudomonas sp.]
MTTQQHAKTVRNLLENAPLKLATQLAKPWHYRRNGRYYLRFRPKGRPFVTFTLSLRTTDRTTAMELSKDILRALAVFHLDQPQATWDELKAQLIVIAEECLSMAHGDESLVAYSMIYDEVRSALAQGSAKASLNVDQQRALGVGQQILKAAQARLHGQPDDLVRIIDDLNERSAIDSHALASPSLSVGTSKEPLAWDKLADSYMAEHSADLKDSTRTSLLNNHKVIQRAFEAIGVADLRVHTRDDLVKLRGNLAETRMASTVNGLIQNLTTVLSWGVRNDHLAKAYTTKLKFTKGADSSRKAFSREQVVALMDHAGGMPADSWERWALSLLAITGGRVGEICQLTKVDVQNVDGYWCIDINEQTGEKSVKNKHSIRRIPLVGGALGFDLTAFLTAVKANALPSDHQDFLRTKDGRPRPTDAAAKAARGSKALGTLLRKVLGESLDENQTLHSLRHHLVSSMKSAGVPVAFAQAVTGHASRTITYDGYGSDIPLQKAYEAIQQGLMGAAQ